jgi:hypothetical protein
MENNENLVTETEEVVTENVEQTTEETPKTYTEDELNAKVNEIVGKRIARKEAKIRKEYDRKYGELEEVLRAGTGKDYDNTEDMTGYLKGFYEKRGIKMPEKPSYNDRDNAILAKAEADDIISAGFDEVVEEVDRLAEKGVANMTAREKAVFKTLAEYRKATEESRELSSLGVTEDVYRSEDFKKFASQFNPTTPIKDVYNIYRQTQPKKEVKPMGSMRDSQITKEKDYYSPDEIARLTPSELKDPNVWEVVRRSMTKGR